MNAISLKLASARSTEWNGFRFHSDLQESAPGGGQG